MPVKKIKAYGKKKKKERETLCPQHVKRDRVHTAKKEDNREGPELVRDGKNGMERSK